MRVRRYPVLNRIGTVLDMPYGRLTVGIVVGWPRPGDVAAGITQRNLVGTAVKLQGRHEQFLLFS
jgi:hypothetical protein